MKTNVTIISTSINMNLFSNYKDYFIIKDNFNLNDLSKYKKVIFYNILNNKDDNEVNNIYDFCKSNNISFINIANNMEHTLLTNYLIVYDNEKIAIEGNTKDVLNNSKLLKRLGLNLPFYFDLSLLLKDYELINDIYLDKESLKSVLWK